MTVTTCCSWANEHSLPREQRIALRAVHQLDRLRFRSIFQRAFVSVSPLFPRAGNRSKIFTALIALAVTALNGVVLAFGMFNKFTTHADLKRQWMGFSLRAWNARTMRIGKKSSEPFMI